MKLPILTKDIIRKNLPELKATNIPASKFMESHSSGSTGEPLTFYSDNQTYSRRWAQTFRCWGWAGYEPGDPYVKISLNPRQKFTKRVQDALMRCSYVYSFGINEQTIDSYLQKMKNAKIIRGYPTSLYLMAKLMEKADMHLHPSAITTTGDMLFPHYRKAIETQFNCRVFDGYGGEGIVASFECEKHEGYHICQEDTVIEFLRGDEHANPGETGEIILTNLNNYVMPFLRYKVGDLGKSSDHICSCGRNLSMMESIEGRDSDIIVTPSGDFLVVHFFTIFFDHLAGVDQFQVRQKSIDNIIILIVKNDKFTTADEQYIKSGIQKYVGENVRLEMDYVESIPLSRSGKRRFVISDVPLKF